MSARVISVPESLHKALGEEATEDLVKLINEVAVTTSSSKVDKSEYDAHTDLIRAEFGAHKELISAQFEGFKAEIGAEIAEFRGDVKASVKGALLTGLAWVTVLLAGLFGAIYTLK